MAANVEDKGKAKALDIAIAQLEKQFGRGTLVRLGDDSFKDGVEAISTGIPRVQEVELDDADESSFDGPVGPSDEEAA